MVKEKNISSSKKVIFFISIVIFNISTSFAFELNTGDEILVHDNSSGNIVLELKAHNLNQKGYFFIGKLHNKHHTISEFSIYGYIKKETSNTISIMYTHQIGTGMDELTPTFKDYFESKSHSNDGKEYLYVNYKQNKIDMKRYLTKLGN